MSSEYGRDGERSAVVGDGAAIELIHSRVHTAGVVGFVQRDLYRSGELTARRGPGERRGGYGRDAVEANRTINANRSEAGVVPGAHVDRVHPLARTSRARSAGEVEASRGGFGILGSAVKRVSGSRSGFTEYIAGIGIPLLGESSDAVRRISRDSRDVCHRPADNLVGVIPVTSCRTREADGRIAEVAGTVGVDPPRELQSVE